MHADDAARIAELESLVDQGLQLLTRASKRIAEIRGSAEARRPEQESACTRCKTVMPVSEFPPRADGSPREMCGECVDSYFGRRPVPGSAHTAGNRSEYGYRFACREAHGNPENTTCHLCGNPNGADAHVDHLTPLSKGGTDNPSNLRWAHPRCNLSRNNKPLTDTQLSRIYGEAEQ